MVPNVFLFPCAYVRFMYLSLPFMFMSFAFYFYVLSFYKIMSNFRACSFQNMFIALGHWFFSFSSMPVFASFQFFTSSNVLLSSSHFTLLYFISMHLISAHFPFMCVIFHVLPLSGHILSSSLHAMSKISQIEFSECMTVVTMVVTIYMSEYWKNQIHTHTKTCPFVFVPFPFHFCSHSFHACLFSCQFPFTSFHVPSISVNHIFVLRLI